MESIQTHDPLSWHCHSSHATHPHTFWQRRRELLTSNLPRPRRQPSPPPPIRPVLDPADDERHHVVRAPRHRVACPLVISIDTLRWPPQRHVKRPVVVAVPRRGRRRTRSVDHTEMSASSSLWTAKRVRRT